MGGLVLISLGLSDERDMSLRALEEARRCDLLYAELYTTLLNTDVERLSRLLGRDVTPLRRRDLEEGAERVLREAEERRVGVLVGGDCLAATTHVSLLLEAKRRGIETHVVHGSSILTAVAETGLSLYRFGKTVTVPLPQRGIPPLTPYRVLGENLERGLHTLLLLDLDVEGGRHLTVNEAMRLLLGVEEEECKGVFTEETLAVGAARLGSESATIKGGRVRRLLDMDFGPPPHVLIVPGRLHFVEEEALKFFAGCREEDLRGRERYLEDLEARTEKYIRSCERVFGELRVSSLPRSIDEEGVREILGYAEMYLRDAKYYLEEGRRASALSSVSYCEGILDALRMLRFVEFDW